MRILMTGMSTRTVGSPRLRLHYLNFNPLLKLALEGMGHQVTQRRITYGEEGLRDQFDVALIHVNPLDKIVCSYSLEACYALEQLEDRAIIFLEDWVSCELRRSWLHVLDVRWEKWLRWKGLKLDPNQEMMMRRVLRQVVGERCPWPIIANFYGWGQPEKFFKDNFSTTDCRIIDPSSMAIIPEFTKKPKEHRWVLATLQKHDTWVDRQGFTWPVERYGNARQGFPVLGEKEVTQRYAESWGVLAPRYPVVGWFRPRFLMAAATGSVLFCDPSEGKFLDPVYCLSRTQAEGFTDWQLETLAANQAQVLGEKVWGRERLVDELSMLLRGVAVEQGTHVSLGEFSKPLP